ncbi:MAG: hypothetical protein SGI71_01200 [Verrucomicrobiota bacterium]|nr:hypothetical protein [Verrucomicrobiota bacterium]
MSEIGLAGGFKRFDSMNYGFSIRPPTGWIISIEPKKVIFSHETSAGIEFMEVFSFPAESDLGQAAEDRVFDAAAYDRSYRFKNAHVYQIPGHTTAGLLIERNFDGVGVKAMEFLILHQKKIYVIVIGATPDLYLQEGKGYIETVQTFKPREG